MFSAGYATDADILVFDSATYADIAAIDTALETFSTATTGLTKDLILIWSDSIGNVHVAAAVGATGATSTNDGGDEYTTTDYFSLSNITLSGIASLVSTGDFTYA